MPSHLAIEKREASRLPASLLMWSAGRRALAAAVIAAGLWITVIWALAA
jgi:hypothetical protein